VRQSPEGQLLFHDADTCRSCHKKS
jgi:hypothetical protein